MGGKNAHSYVQHIISFKRCLIDESNLRWECTEHSSRNDHFLHKYSEKT